MYSSKKSGDVSKFPSELYDVEDDKPTWTRGETAADKKAIKVA
jgi:hypothetical protein